MAQITYDISADQGTDYAVTFTYRDSNNALVNLTGATARMQVRRFVESSYPFLTIPSGNGITLGGAAGTIALVISAASLSAIPAGAYKYDIEIITSSSTVVKLIAGNFILNGEVTR
jgi:hypothetical protein